MGPQFTFRAYSKLPESSDSPVTFLHNVNEDGSSSLLQPISIHSLLSPDFQRSIPPWDEVRALQSAYGSPRPLDAGTDFLSTRGSTLLQRSPLSAGTSPGKPMFKPGISRGAPGRVIEAAGSPSSLHPRWRHRSGDFGRAINVIGLPDTSRRTTESSVFIEGGSYQDSTPGGSLSSLLGPSVDDVALCIAEAIQDHDTWSTDKSSMDLVPVFTPTDSTVPSNSSSFGFQAVISYQAVESLESALTEADFPSQETSPKHVASSARASEPETDVPALSLLPDPAGPTKVHTGDEFFVVNPVLRKSKRSKKGKQRLHKGVGSAGELPQEIHIVGANEQEGRHTSLTSPSPSGRDSLSSSPVLTDDMKLRSKHSNKIRSGCRSSTNSPSKSGLAYFAAESDQRLSPENHCDTVLDSKPTSRVSIIRTQNPDTSDIGSD